jgi:hypothetical protein
MRLVLEYTVTDDCTYSFTETVPVEYASPEDLIVDLMDAALAALNGPGDGTFKLVGRSFNACVFYAHVPADKVGEYRNLERTLVSARDCKYCSVPPTILTLDEWFGRGAA